MNSWSTRSSHKSFNCLSYILILLDVRFPLSLWLMRHRVKSVNLESCGTCSTLELAPLSHWTKWIMSIKDHFDQRCFDSSSQSKELMVCIELLFA